MHQVVVSGVDVAYLCVLGFQKEKYGEWVNKGRDTWN